jgi:Spy/CpxP family protein refolding chaperone
MKSPTRSFKRPVAVAVITMAGALAAYAQTGPGAGPGYGPGYGPGPGHGPMMHGGPGDGAGGFMGGMIYRMLDRVNATPEQRTQIQQIVERNREAMRAEHDAGRALRDQAMALFAQPDIDVRAVEALREKQVARMDAASRQVTQAMLDIAKVLTPDQRKQMADEMQQRRAMMERRWRERQGTPAGKS